MSILHFNYEQIASPLGKLLVVYDRKNKLRALDWVDYESRMHLLIHRQYKDSHIQLTKATACNSTIAQQIHAYFDGELQSLSTIEVELGGTVFQREVWSALQNIAAGQSISYGQLAMLINRPTAVRAVGVAIGANPISLVIPCHRVIGKDKTLTGYAGGLDRKHWLLLHENIAFKK